MEFQCGDRVIYGAHGVCKITAVEQRRVDRKTVEYYVLEPVDGSGSRYYVPMHNELAVAKLKNVLTENEVRSLLASQDVRQNIWIEDEGLRKQRYKELIVGGDRVALLGMVHSLYRHREQQVSAGRKFHLCDENFLRDAQKLIGSEFALALNVSEKEVEEIVKNAFQ